VRREDRDRTWRLRRTDPSPYQCKRLRQVHGEAPRAETTGQNNPVVEPGAVGGDHDHDGYAPLADPAREVVVARGRDLELEPLPGGEL